MRCTFCNTCRFEPLVNSVQTEVTFDCITRVGIFYRYFPWAGLLACHAANAFLLINVDDPIIPLHHGIGGTNWGAHRVLAMSAGRKCYFQPGDTCYFLKWCTFDLTEKRAYRQIFIYLAVNFTTMAGDAAACVEVDSIFFHSSTLLFVLRILLRT